MKGEKRYESNDHLMFYDEDDTYLSSYTLYFEKI